MSRASGLSDIDAFSGLPAYNAVLNGDISALAPSPNPNPDGAPIGGIAAFSAVPGYLGTDPPEVAPDIPYEAPIMAQARVAPESESSSTTPTIGSSPLTSVAPAVDEEEVTPTPTDNSGADSQNIVRDSKKFTPGSTGNSPILFGTVTGVSTTACPAGNRASRSLDSEASSRPAAPPPAWGPPPGSQVLQTNRAGSLRPPDFPFMRCPAHCGASCA